MIKRCPLCNRTYADETISFCLADGALLSAPYDSAQVTEQFPAARSTEPPPTEVLPHNLNPAQPAREAVPVNSTIASPVATPLHASPAPNKTGRWLWPVGGLCVLLVVAIFIIGYNVGSERKESSNSNSMAQNPPVSDSSPELPKINPPDDPKIYTPDEVDQKAQILSKPSPEYTEAARQNQVTGKVALKMVLTSSGTVTDIKVVSGLPDGLTEKAMEAAREIKFTPATKDGQPVSQSFTVGYYFNLY